jgi:hypothetical protein
MAVLARCGVCQERPFAYGPDVEVAVPEPADPRRWRTLRLRDVQPHRFARVFPDHVWPYQPGSCPDQLTGLGAAAAGSATGRLTSSGPWPGVI